MGKLRFEHARDLLVADDAESVLAAGNPIVAAELRPAMAAQWLHPVIENNERPYQDYDRAQTVAALWRIAGPSEAAYIVNWYFTDPPDLRAVARSAFLEAAIAQPRPELRDLVARIVGDPRLDETGVQSTCTLLRVVNPWLPKPLVSEQEMSGVHGDEMVVGTKPLLEWHRKLRDSAVDWNPKH